MGYMRYRELWFLYGGGGLFSKSWRVLTPLHPHLLEKRSCLDVVLAQAKRVGGLTGQSAVKG